MAEYLPFWPKAAAGAYVGAQSPVDIFSRAFPTNGAKEVVVQMQIDADFGVAGTTYVQVYPQISNDGINWETQDSGGTFKINAAGTFPAQVTEKYTEIGAFMRMKIEIYNGELVAMVLAPTILIAGTARS